jgi:hypothetical protein
MRWPLLGTDRIKKTVQAYGFFFFALLALMREPDQKVCTCAPASMHMPSADQACTRLRGDAKQSIRSGTTVDRMHALPCLLTSARSSVQGRCDLYPPVEWYERLRFSYGEYGLLLAFTVGALYAADPYRITAILNWSDTPKLTVSIRCILRT